MSTQATSTCGADEAAVTALISKLRGEAGEARRKVNDAWAALLIGTCQGIDDNGSVFDKIFQKNAGE